MANDNNKEIRINEENDHHRNNSNITTHTPTWKRRRQDRQGLLVLINMTRKRQSTLNVLL